MTQLNKKLEDSRTGIIIPNIIEDDGTGRKQGYDVFSRLLKDNIVSLTGPVTEQSAAIVVAQLLFLDSAIDPENNKKPITLEINSPGGSVTAGMAIYDTMMRMKNPVRTVAKGMAASMGSFLLMAGAPGERYALPNAEVMIHEAAAGTRGKVTEMESMTDLFSRTNGRLFKMYEFHTGMSQGTFRKLMERKDTFINAEEAKALGLIDHVAYETHAPADQHKKAWSKMMEEFNKEEAAQRGKPRAPAIDDNIIEIAEEARKAKKGGNRPKR